MEPSAITVMIDRLVEHGFVKRLADEQDRRVTLLAWDQERNGCTDKARIHSQEILSKLLQTLEPMKWNDLFNPLNRDSLAASTLE